jgi:hypothetical protein
MTGKRSSIVLTLNTHTITGDPLPVHNLSSYYS